MNNSHYPSLDRCKKLSELGFPQTQHCWYFGGDRCENDFTLLDRDDDSVSYTVCYVCPSVMEMMDMAPKLSGEFWISLEKLSNSYHVCVRETSNHERIAFDGTLPNALADLIVWLVENSHLTFPSNG